MKHWSRQDLFLWNTLALRLPLKKKKTIHGHAQFFLVLINRHGILLHEKEISGEKKGEREQDRHSLWLKKLTTLSEQGSV